MTRDFANALARALLPCTGVVLLLALWYLASYVRVIDPVLLPSPVAMMEALWRGMTVGSLAHDFARTVERTTVAMLVAAVIAVPLGILLGSSEQLYRSVEFVIDFFRSTPASAVFPLFLVVFGVGDKTKIYVASFGASLVILFNVAYGVVMLLESLPQTFVGLRNGVSLALVIVVVAEMFIGSVDGLGHAVFDAQQMFEMPDMYASIFAAGALGYGLNLMFLLVEKRVVHWSGK